MQESMQHILKLSFSVRFCIFMHNVLGRSRRKDTCALGLFAANMVKNVAVAHVSRKLHTRAMVGGGLPW